ncbi:MAG TPA: hypothetical protein VKQ27_18475 [Acetobacteraceae bacterium]|nr:hypothetical protein [Acetobacteraceae bacterium]
MDLFEFVAIGPLDDEAAPDALRLPIEREGELIDEDALAELDVSFFQVGFDRPTPA